MIQVQLKNCKPNKDKLLSFGFEAADGGYVYCSDIVEGQMKLTVRIDRNEKIYTKVTDIIGGDEYVLHLVTSATGTFVGRVKSEYDKILEEIRVKCFDSEVFKSGQAKEVIAYIRNTYGDEFEYLWKKFPDNAVVRRKDNRKWYAAVLTVSRKKLGFDSDDTVEILDLRLNPAEIETTVDNLRYFPGYHMNKKHWITVCLDGTVNTETIFSRIDDSYVLALK